MNAKGRTKYFVIAVWLSFFIVSIYLYFFENSLIREGFESISGISITLGYLLYVVISSLRGFTLIPVTYFIVIGLILFPPLPLYLLTLIGILFSSLSVYYFSEYLNFDQYFEEKYPKHITKITNFLSKNELPIVTFWSMAPFLPTDLICYVCGSLEVNVKKFILGVLIGEGIVTGIYIYLGTELLLQLVS